MVREAAGPNPVVLVEGALQEFVRVTVGSRVFKAERQKSRLVAFSLHKLQEAVSAEEQGGHRIHLPQAAPQNQACWGQMCFQT